MGEIGKEGFGFADLFRTSGRIFKKHFGTIAAIGFGIYLPIEAVLAAIVPEATGIKDAFEIMQVEALFEILLGTVAALVVMRLTANEINRESTRFGEVWKAAVRRYFSTVATTIAMNMVAMGLLFAAAPAFMAQQAYGEGPLKPVFFALIGASCIPAIMGLNYMSFYMQVPALREETGFHALKHSKSVVEGHFWKVAGYSILFLIGVEVFGSLNAIVPGAFAATLIGAAGDVVNLFFVMVATVLYLHLDRIRFGYEE